MIQLGLFVPDLLDAWGDLPAFLDKVKAAYAGTKILPRIHFLAYRASPGGCQVERTAWDGARPSGRCTMPWLPVGEHTRDNGSKFPLYRLTGNWNKAYFDKLDYVLTAMRKRGILAEVSALDIRRRSGDDKYRDPAYCSEEALGPHTPGGVWGEPGKCGMMNFHRNWIRILTRHVLKRQPNALFESCNEFNTPTFAHEAGDEFDQYLYEKCRPALVSFLGLSGVAASKIWTSGDTRNWRGGGAWYSAHGIVRPERVAETLALGVPPGRLIISADGGFGGDGDADIAGRKGASIEQAIGIVRAAKAKKMRKVETMPRKLWLRNKHVADLDLFNPDVLAASAEEGARK